MEFPLTQTFDDLLHSLESAGPCEVDDIQAARKKLQRQNNDLTKESRRRNRKADPTIEPPIQIDTGKHFLGRAMVSVAFDNLGGNGPRITHSPLQREVVQAEVRKLVTLAGEGGSTLFRTDPQHELVVTIDEDDINLQTLTKDVQGPFPTARFKKGANLHICQVEDGQQRIEALREVFSSLFKQSQSYKDAVDNNSSDENSKKLLKESLVKLKEKVVWLVAFYGRRSIDEDATCRQAVYLKLASNNAHKGRPDTPSHHFRQIVVSLAKTTTTADRKMVWELATTLEPDAKSNVRILLKKFPDIVFAFTFLFRFKPFYSFGFDPKRLVQTKKTVWGIINPFIIGSIQLVTFLVSKEPLPLNDGETLSKANSHLITSRIQTILAEKQEGYFLDIADLIYTVAAFHYRTTLSNSSDYFGIHSELWQKNFKKYKEGIKAGIRTRVAAELGQQKSPWNNSQKAILQALPDKFDAVIDYSLFSGPNAVPTLDGMVPFLCPEFLDNLITHCMTIEPVVALMCKWIVPNLDDHHQQRSSSKTVLADEEKTFQSDFELMLNSLQYFIGYEVEGMDWEHTSVGHMLRSLPNGSEKSCKDVISELTDELISLIFRERHRTLIPFIAPIQRMISEPSKILKDSVLKAHLDLELTIFLLELNKWADLRRKIRDNPPIALTRRTTPVPPEDLVTALEALSPVWQKVASGHVVTTFGWDDRHNNTPAVRKRFALNMLKESLHYMQSHRPFLLENPKLLAFRDKFIATVTNAPGLQNMPLWCTFSIAAPAASQTSTVFEDDVVADNIVLRESVKYDGMLDRAFSTFLKALAKPGLIGIPVDSKRSSHAIHPGAAKYLKALRKKVKTLQADCKAIHLNNSTYELRYNGPFQTIFEGEDSSLDWNLATQEQLVHYYETLPEQQSSQPSEGEDSNTHEHGICPVSGGRILVPSSSPITESRPRRIVAMGKRKSQHYLGLGSDSDHGSDNSEAHGEDDGNEDDEDDDEEDNEDKNAEEDEDDDEDEDEDDDEDEDEDDEDDEDKDDEDDEDEDDEDEDESDTSEAGFIDDQAKVDEDDDDDGGQGSDIEENSNYGLSFNSDDIEIPDYPRSISSDGSDEDSDNSPPPACFPPIIKLKVPPSPCESNGVEQPVIESEAGEDALQLSSSTAKRPSADDVVEVSSKRPRLDPVEVTDDDFDYWENMDDLPQEEEEHLLC